MQSEELITSLNTTLEIALPPESNTEQLHSLLSAHINQLIENDFQKLVNLLYRIDVNEARLREFLSQNADKEAGPEIADLIIERQLQKIKSRKEFQEKSNPIDDNEKW
jgi:hypothetical protein